MKKIHLLLCAFPLLFSSCEDDYSASGSYPNGYYTDGEFGVIGDQYNEYEENPFVNVADQPVSTFSIDADGASYANVRRFLMQEGQKPPKGAIRTEELINYFSLDYPFTETAHPISLNGEISGCPWNDDNKLIRIGIKGKELLEKPASNFVFLIDVSGSMSSSDKLDLLKQGFSLLVDELTAEDRISIVTYAGSAGVVLPSTSGDKKSEIKSAISRLGSGGSTAGAEGIITAYQIASENFIEGGNNRVILGSDGDFNVGPSSQEELVALIEEKRESGIFLTVLGVGRGNLNDAAMEQIANNGNGTYEYIDKVEQLKKVFIYDFQKFFTVAKDVKVQVAFNPELVLAYRLIGYENRVLNQEDFEDDNKDAGEIGANQNITALYEIVPAVTNSPNIRIVPTFTIDFRYKLPDADTSIPMEMGILDEEKSFSQSSDFMKFTSSVAAFSMLLSDSQYSGTATFDKVSEWLNATNLNDQYGFKSEFKELVKQGKSVN